MPVPDNLGLGLRASTGLNDEPKRFKINLQPFKCAKCVSHSQLQLPTQRLAAESVDEGVDDGLLEVDGEAVDAVEGVDAVGGGLAVAHDAEDEEVVGGVVLPQGVEVHSIHDLRVSLVNQGLHVAVEAGPSAAKGLRK